MSNCSNCGENTKLHEMGKPTCVKCDNANAAERRVRGQQGRGSPEPAAASIGVRAQASEDTPTNHLAEVTGIRRGS